MRCEKAALFIMRPLSFLLSLMVLLPNARAANLENRTSLVAGVSTVKTNQQIFQVKGVVVELEPDGRTVKVKHEAIPNYMPAMTMPFEVKDTNELAGLKTGDAVSFRMIVATTDGWIDRIQKLDEPPPTKALPAKIGSIRFVRDVDPMNIGELLPEYYFTNQLGQAVSTSQFKGSALAINFIFTRCPFPTFCPAMARHFAEAQAKLTTATNGPANWHLLTISFDPEYDTPSVLKSYAEHYACNPARWDFVTGDLVEITAIADGFQMEFWHDPSGSLSHNLRTAVIDASGRLQRLFAGNQWTSDDLVAEITKAAAK